MVNKYQVELDYLPLFCFVFACFYRSHYLAFTTFYNKTELALAGTNFVNLVLENHFNAFIFG